MASPKVAQNIKFENVQAETNAEKLKRKMLQDPFVPIGIMGGIGALGWGVYSYKSKGSMSTSIFLMRLRVVAQSMIVGAMTLGVAVNLYRKMNKKE